MGTFASEIPTLKYTSNVVVYFKTRAKWFGIYSPDSDTGVLIDSLPANQLGLSNPKLNPASLSIEDASTSFQTFAFEITDKSLVVTAEMVDNEALFMNEQIDIYIGRTGVSMDFGNYFQMPTMRIRSFSYVDNVFKFTAESIDADFKRPSFRAFENLNADTALGAGTLVMKSNISSDFPAAGTLYIDDDENSEVLAYTSYTSATFTLTGNTANAHDEGVNIYVNETVTGNPIDVAMQLLTGGTDALADTINGATLLGATTIVATTDVSAWPATGLVYIEDGTSSEFVKYTSISGLNITTVATAFAHTGSEVIRFALREGLQVDPDLFDLTEIEALRDEFFGSDSYSFEMHNIDNTLKWIEDEIFLTCNLRFTSNASGLYTFTLLDELGFGGTVVTFDEDNVIGKPTYKTSNQEVRTRVRLNYGYDYNTQKYTRYLSSESATALAIYGEQETFIVSSKGIPDSAPGDTIATDRVGRWLERLSTTRPVITVKTFFNTFTANIGDGVLVDLKLPSETGTLTFLKSLEVQKKTIDLSKGVITWELTATSETGLRRTFIAPSDALLSAPTTTTLTVASGRGAQYKVGWEVSFYNENTFAKISGPFGISNIAADTITIDEAHGAVTGNLMRFANYDEIVVDQQRYGFIGPNAGTFASDGTPLYKINF